MLKLKEKIQSFSFKDVMDCRLEIFGLSAIWIVMFHIYGNIGMISLSGASVFSKIFSFGNAGVDVFLFLSAIGLYGSMKKNTIANFYKNRIVRMIIPYVVIAIPYFVWFDFFFKKDGIIQFILNTSTLNFWITGDHPVWYVAFAAVIYMIFPVLYKLDVKTKHIFTSLLIPFSIVIEYVLFKTDSIIYANAERALSRIPIFLVGMLMANIVLKKKRITCWQLIVAVAIGIAIFAILVFCPLPLVVTRYLYGAFAICIVVAYSFIRRMLPLRFLYVIFAWLGTISLEIYMVHVFALRIIKNYGLWTVIPYKFVWYLLIVGLSVGVAKLLSVAIGKVIKIIKQKRKVKACE